MAAQGNPGVSVLIPVRDAATTLAPCLASLRRQTDPDWECVLVDDGSRDASAGLARAAAREDPRIRLLERGREGIVPALRAGLAACRAPLVARMDADDLMHRERLVRQRALLAAHPGWSAVGCHVRMFPRRDLRPGGRAYEAWLNAIDSPRRVREEAFVECPVAHPALLIRRAVLAGFGYRDVDWAEDYDLVLRLLAAGHEIGVVPRRLLCWRRGHGRLSGRDPRYADLRFTDCKAAFLAAGFLAGSAEYVLWGYGRTGRQLRRALATRGKRPSHIVELHPGRLHQRIHGAPVVAPDALASLPRRPLVVSVAGTGPRAQIRAALAELGFRELDDYVCAA